MRAVNLIPADQRRGGGGGFTGRSGGAAYVVVAVICGLALVAALYGEAKHEIGTKQAEASRLSAEAQQAAAQASKLAPYASFVAMREERLKDVQELANTRFDWAHAMHELGRVLPTDASLTSVAGSVGATTESSSSSSSSSAKTTGSSTVTSATPAGSVPTFQLSGCATSQSEVALTMDRLRLIDGVSEVSLQSSTKGGSGGGKGSSGGCPEGYPTFSLQVTFDALPTPTVKVPAARATDTSVSDSKGASR